jgi:parvulin-like peptidyl-prolyl isomerase
MTNITTKLFTATLGAALLAATATAQTNASAPAKAGDKIDELFGDTAVAKGKGIEIKRRQLDSAMVNIKASFSARGQVYSPDQLNQIERRVLDDLISVQILLNKATDADKVKAKEVADKRFDTVKTRAGSDDALSRQLKMLGMTEEALRAKMVEQATAEAVAERELKINVTDADASKFYADNPAKFEQPEMVRASHILLMTQDPTTHAPLSDEQQKAKRKQIDDLLKRARAGEDFAKLAKEYSEDPGSKDKGGEITFPRGNQGIPAEFEAAAFALNTNQVSDVVTTPFGYHIIKLSEKLPAKKIELAKVADELKEALRQQEMQKLLPDYMEKLKKDAAVEILDEKLKAVIVPSLAPVEPMKSEKAEAKKPAAGK